MNEEVNIGVPSLDQALEGNKVSTGPPDACIPWGAGHRHHTWHGGPEHQLLAPGSVARKNRCDSISARPAQPSRKLRIGPAYGNLSRIPQRRMDSTKVQRVGKSNIVLRTPQSRCQGPGYGRDSLQRPRLITSPRQEQVLLPRPATAHTPEHRLERMREGLHTVACKA